MCPTNDAHTVCGRQINILRQPGKKMVWGAPCKCAMQDHIIRYRITPNRIRRRFDDLLDSLYLRQNGREVEDLMRPKVKDALERVVREMVNQGLIEAREEDGETWYQWRVDADNFLGIGAWNHDWSEEASQGFQAAHRQQARVVSGAAAPGPRSRSRACPPAQTPTIAPAPGKKPTTLDQKVNGCQTKTGGIGTGVIAGVGTIGGSVNYNHTIKIYHRHGDDDEGAAAISDSDDDEVKREDSEDSDDDEGWGFQVDTDSESEDIEMGDAPPMHPVRLHQHTHDHKHEHRWKGDRPEIPPNDWPSPPQSPPPSPPPTLPSPPSSSICAPSWGPPPSMPPSMTGWESLPNPPQQHFPAPPSTMIGWESAPSERGQAPSTVDRVPIPSPPLTQQRTTPRPTQPHRAILFPGPGPRPRPRPVIRPHSTPTTELIPARQQRIRSDMDRQAVRNGLLGYTEHELLQAVDEIAAALISDYTWRWKVNGGEDPGLVADLTERRNYRLDYLDVIGELLDEMSGVESAGEGIFARTWWWLEE